MGYVRDDLDPKISYRGGELPFHHPTRMRMDAEQCLCDMEMWLTIGFSLAMHVKHMLLVIEEHGLTHVLEKNTSVKHLFKNEILGHHNAELISKEREEELNGNRNSHDRAGA